jgi:2-methylcitrate dehydratase PrpD
MRSIRLSAQAPGPLMQTLSTFMADAARRVLPPEATEHAKQHILDTLAAMVSGSQLPPGEAALRFARAQAGKGHRYHRRVQADGRTY